MPGKVRRIAMALLICIGVVSPPPAGATDPPALVSNGDLFYLLDPSDVTAPFGTGRVEVVLDPSRPALDLAGAVVAGLPIAGDATHRQRWRIEIETPDALRVQAPSSVVLEPGDTRVLPLWIDGRAMAIGNDAVIGLRLVRGAAIRDFDISVARRQGAVSVESHCSPATSVVGDVVTCRVSVQNTARSAGDITLTNPVPAGLDLIPSSVAGGFPFGATVVWGGELDGAGPPALTVTVDDAAAPAGYFPLRPFHNSLEVTVGDDGMAMVSVPTFAFGGDTFSRIGIGADGYLSLGDVAPADPDRFAAGQEPGTILAPYWTDLLPATGGRILVNTLTNGHDQWIVVEWEFVLDAGGGRNTFQAWIGYSRPDDVAFVYGPNLGGGAGGKLVVGASIAGNPVPAILYHDGTGTAPAPSFPYARPGFEVDVAVLPGVPGESHTTTFAARANGPGPWVSTSYVFSPLLTGTAIATARGSVVAD